MNRSEILASLRERIVSYAAWRISRDSAEDLAQEVLLVIEQKYPHLENLDDLLPLSIRILHFKTMAVRRKAARRGETRQVAVEDVPLAEPGASPLRTAEGQELLERMSKALGSLGSRCRELMRYKLQGLSFPQIQARMGAASINTVYTWDSRCRKELLDRMGIRPEDLP